MKEKLWLCWGSAGGPDGFSAPATGRESPGETEPSSPVSAPAPLLKGSTQGARLCPPLMAHKSRAHSQSGIGGFGLELGSGIGIDTLPCGDGIRELSRTRGHRGWAGQMRRAAHQIPFPEASPAARRPSLEYGAPDPPSKPSQAHGAFEASRVRGGAIRPVDPVYGKHLAAITCSSESGAAVSVTTGPREQTGRYLHIKETLTPTPPQGSLTNTDVNEPAGRRAPGSGGRVARH